MLAAGWAVPSPLTRTGGELEAEKGSLDVAGIARFKLSKVKLAQNFNVNKEIVRVQPFTIHQHSDQNEKFYDLVEPEPTGASASSDSGLTKHRLGLHAAISQPKPLKSNLNAIDLRRDTETSTCTSSSFHEH